MSSNAHAIVIAVGANETTKAKIASRSGRPF